MLEDMVSAVRALAGLEIGFTLAQPEAAAPLIQFSSINRVIFSFSFSKWRQSSLVGGNYCTWLRAAFPEGKYMRVVPVMFSVGVNENQAIANYTNSGDLALEHAINTRGLHELQRCGAQLCCVASVFDSVGACSYCDGFGGELPTILSRLAELVNGDSYKQVEILSISARCAQLVGGARWLSCKSGKDRTGMMCTLEAIEVCCAQEVPAVQQQCLDKIRFGLRLTNCMLNIGKRAYAFNSFQVQTFPKLLVPRARRHLWQRRRFMS